MEYEIRDWVIEQMHAPAHVMGQVAAIDEWVKGFLASHLAKSPETYQRLYIDVLDNLSVNVRLRTLENLLTDLDWAEAHRDIVAEIRSLSATRNVYAHTKWNGYPYANEWHGVYIRNGKAQHVAVTQADLEVIWDRLRMVRLRLEYLAQKSEPLTVDGIGPLGLEEAEEAASQGAIDAAKGRLAALVVSERAHLSDG